MGRTVNLTILGVLLALASCYDVAVAPDYGDVPYGYDYYNYYWPYSGSFHGHREGSYTYRNYRFGGFHDFGGYHHGGPSGHGGFGGSSGHGHR